MLRHTATRGSLLYRAGDTTAIRNAYHRAIEAHEELERTAMFIKQTIGNVRFTCKELCQELGMARETKRFECEHCRLDLNDAPICEFSIKDHDIDPRDPVNDQYRRGIEEIGKIMKTLYLATGVSPLAVQVAPPWMHDLINREDAPPFTAESLAKDRYEYLSWLIVFSPPVVETYGRETLLDAPAYHVEELADGSVLIITDKDPYLPSEYENVADHIGIESY